ncbi:hypothetical protein NDU88_002309 [Pleurodeles waltl]|uniref:Uncharacterized protein n=1 Tax=Pleurodeles waltl TaxID=8319 RepID=A0AAV7KV06_PLEWA|nr:hypothetical protein NDU88_002309 [Pleurodeles waltl]
MGPGSRLIKGCSSPKSRCLAQWQLTRASRRGPRSCRSQSPALQPPASGAHYSPAGHQRHPPGPPPHHSSGPQGRKAQGPPRSPSRRKPRPPTTGVSTGPAVPPSRSAAAQASQALRGSSLSGASDALCWAPDFTPSRAAKLCQRPGRRNTDKTHLLMLPCWPRPPYILCLL